MRNFATMARLSLVVLLVGSLYLASDIVHPPGDPAPDLLADDPDLVAIDGYDPVAYFVDGRPVRGSPRHAHVWGGREWRFTSAENLIRFRTDPSRYAPKYGGSSVYGAARGKRYTADPRLFDIIGGRLYLSRNQQVRELWLRNPAGYIARADRRWAAVGEAM